MPTGIVSQTSTGAAPDHEALRTANNVRLVTEAEEGLGLNRIPHGVYGFTYSPCQPEAPLFLKASFHSFEIHRLTGGRICLLGFVTPEAARRLDGSSADSNGIFQVSLFPDATGEASLLASIDTSRIVRHKQHSQREATGLQLEIA